MDFRATNDNINRNNVDSEIGTLERFEAELKNTIFGVMFVLLKEQEVSIYTSFILAILQFLQLMIFPFHKTINKVWNSPKVVDVLSSIFNYFNIVPYLDSTTFSLYLTFFYVGMAILAIAILNMLYISYAFARRTLLSFTWPIILLRYIATLFITILFLPYIDYFVSMLACVTDTRTSTLVHSYFTEIECWTGTHVIHAIFAIIGTLAFVLFTSVVSLTYFEYKSVTNDPNARINARPNFLFILYKFVMVICLTFLTGDQFEVLLLALILVGSLILFIKFYFRTPYHNETVSKMWSTLTAVNLWTAVMLVFAKIMENTLFEGSIIAWLLGMPFIILIIVTNRDHRVDLLLINVNKFQNGEEIHEQIRYLLKLIEWQATNRNSAILLDGYIEIHKQSCNQEDCPLKQKSVKTSRQFKKLMEDDALNEKYAIVIQLLYKMYSHGIKKFPNNTSLRIAFAFFLLEKMQSKQQALQELSQAEQNKPPFDEQFIIYRYKKIVEDEIAESQTEAIAGLDFVSESAFQNHLRLLQANIEKSALLHMEFWSQLSEDNPDLSKLNDIGSKINSSVHNVEENWNKLLKINSNNAKAMRLYGKFLIEIINDKEAGDELLEKARTISNVQSNKKAIQMVGAAGDDYNSDATPTVWVSGEQEKFGIITGINLAAASLFGYNKTELLNRKVKDMMPPIYAKHHDSFMESYINTGEGPLIGKNKERLVFGKNKSGYIFPVYLSLKAVQSIIQGIQFIATFRVEKTFKNTAYVLAQPDGTIDAISASTISLMKFDIKSVNQKKTNIQDLIPNIIRDRHNMFSSTTGGRTTTAVTYSYPKDSEYLVGDEEATTNLNCQLVELLFLEGRENAGYQFKFERILDKSQYNAHDKKAKISNFQFRFERNKPCIVGEYVEGSTTTDVQSVHDDDVLSGLQNGEQNHSERELSNSARKSQNEEEPENTKIDYGRGIKTLRLVNGKPMDIEENVPEDEEEEGAESYDKNSKDQSQSKQHQQLAQQEEDQQDEGSYKEFSTTFKSRKALTSIVNDKTPPPAIKSLRYIANFIVVVLFVIALLDYLFAINEFDKINNEIDLLDKSNIRLAELMNALSKIRDITLINLGLLGDLAGYDAGSLKLQLQNSLNVAKSLKETLEQSTSTLSTDHLTLLNSNSIPLYSLGSSLPVYKGLTQATEEIISRAFDINSKNSTQIFSNDSDVYFVTYNMLNGFYQGLRDSSGYYAQELSDQVNSKGSSFLIVLIVSIATLVVALLILFPIFFQVNKTREEVLGLFLDIPEKTVKGLYNKCETFISNLQVGEDEDMISEIDEEDLGKQQTEHDNQDFIPRRRRKRFKNLGRSQRTLFIKFLGVTLVIEAYFLFTFISANVLMEDISTLIPELNSTSAAEPFFSFANNAERQLLVNYNFSILFGNAETVATNDIKAMYDLDSLVLEEHSINRKIHTDEYAAIFNQLMMANPCDFMLSLVTNATCTGFADQTVFQGMTVALSRHFENLRTLLSCFTKLKNSSTCTVAPTTSKTVSNNTMLNSMMNLMRTSQATEIDTMQHTYIKQTFRLLMASFKSSLKDSFNDALTVRLIVFIIFVVVLAIIYVFLWLVLMAKITNEIWRTKSMLNMIPLNVISKIKSIRLYLKRFWNERNLAEY